MKPCRIISTHLFQPTARDFAASWLKTTAHLTADLKTFMDRESYKKGNFLLSLFKEVQKRGYEQPRKEVYEFGPFRITGSVDCLVCATLKFSRI